MLLLDMDLNEVQAEYAGIIRDSAETPLAIINDILDFSKIEAGKLHLDVVEFELIPLIEATAELLASKARDKSIALMTFVDPKIPGLLKDDPVRVR